ncbi:RPA-interacting protein, C-terminal domain [Dillenia turbinata]|uniref:RPA-interacting protein, C-terminal domain n=1 Tax=Dillenia turbinata TaxID=194707 RepID=A0AAN8ZKY3_9MAGN
MEEHNCQSTSSTLNRPSINLTIPTGSTRLLFPDIIPDDSNLCIHLFVVKDPHYLFTRQSGAPENYVETWENEEDEYLARAVYEHMDLNSPSRMFYPLGVVLCFLLMFSVNLKFLEARLAEAHAEHFDRGCRMKPVFCIKTMFDLTALFIQCQHCNTYEASFLGCIGGRRSHVCSMICTELSDFLLYKACNPLQQAYPHTRIKPSGQGGLIHKMHELLMFIFKINNNNIKPSGQGGPTDGLET